MLRTALPAAVLGLASLLLLPASPAAAEEGGPSAEVLAWARETVKRAVAEAPAAEPFPADRDWLNVRRPLTLEGDLRGKVVILDFWCYCCINCMHVLPDLEYLERKYAQEPFAVIGVHSAKFANEKHAANIRAAILRYEIHHPVVNDDDFRIWRSYGARSWPTFAILTPDGKILGALSGEGNREDLDALVQATLEHYRAVQPDLLDAQPLPVRLERGQQAPSQLAYPGKLCIDEARGSLFIADSNHNRIVETDLDGHFRRAFGSGARGLVDGPAGQAQFFRPQGLAVHGGALWVCDTENHAIRRVDLATGAVTTAAGTGAKGDPWKLVKRRGKPDDHGPWPGASTALNSPWDILFVGDTGYIAMAGSHSLWAIDAKTREVRHVAGDLTERRLDSADPFTAAFAQPSGLAWDGTDLYVADSESSAIVRVRPGGAVTTLAGASDDPKDLFHFGDEDGVGKGRRFQHPLAVLFHGGTLYVADTYNHKVKTVDPKTGAVRTLVGASGVPQAGGLPGRRLAEPGGLAVQGERLYIVNTNRHSILRQALDGSWQHALPLVDVPLPVEHAGGSVDGGWPELSGTVYVRGPDVAVRAETTLPIGVRIALPEGWKLTPGAPAAARLEVADVHREAAIEGSEAMLLLPALAAGEHQVTVRLLYYACQDAGTCRVRSVSWKLLVTAGPEGRDALVLSDLFLP